MHVRVIDETTYQADMDEKVLPALDQCRTEGWMEPTKVRGQLKMPLGNEAGDQLGKLHYVTYDAKVFAALRIPGGSSTFRGAVVISHGFSEFAGKYAEMTWYFLMSGYSVCFMEYRGHGDSPRDQDPALVWIDDWRRYAGDLDKFASTVGRQEAQGKGLYLYAHSMGGTVGAAVLEHHPSLFDKAVLSAPMISPKTAGLPTWFASAGLTVICGLGLGNRRVPGQPLFSQEPDLKDYPGASQVRVGWKHELRVVNPRYRTVTASFGWVNQALAMCRKVASPEACRRVRTPLLVFEAGADTMVHNAATDDFVKQVGASNWVKRRLVDGAAHEICSMPDAVLKPYLREIFDFLEDSIAYRLGVDY